MATSSARRRTSRAPAARRARVLERDAAEAADHITMRILQGGKAPAVVKNDAPAKGTKKKRGANAPAPSRAPMGAAAATSDQTDADVTAKLLAGAPAFGDVLRSIGHAVAVTQTALDDTALESLKELAAQKVDIPVLITQLLKDDDGTPSSVDIKTASVPLTSIIVPSMQVVEQMTLRMDMKVQSFDATSGIKFNQNIASAGVSYSNHAFGFAVSDSNTNINAQFSNMSDFASGSVMMSLDIVDRTGFTIPTPLQYSIGATVLVRLQLINQTPVPVPDPAPTPLPPPAADRTATFKVALVHVDGTVDQSFAGYDISAPPGLLPDTSTGGTLLIKRTCAPRDPYEARKAYVTYGQITKEISFYL